VVAVVADLVLVPRLGAEGAAIATWLGCTLSAVLTFAVSQRYWPLPYRPLRLAAVFLGGLTLGVLALRLAPEGPWGLAMRAATPVVWVAGAWSMGMFTRAGVVRAGVQA
jgi:O-antigen/teichoic acid export membrane protein